MKYRSQEDVFIIINIFNDKLITLMIVGVMSNGVFNTNLTSVLTTG